MNTPEQYQQLWDTAVVKPSNQLNLIVDKIIANKARYDSVSATTSVPWWFIALLHNMEASLNFKRHIHNGDPLTGRTTHVPAGRPVAGTPPFTWEFSTEDGMRYKGLDKVKDWSIPNILAMQEKWNGLGYSKKGINTPYLWCGTNHYGTPPHIGKYPADGQFDPNMVSQQIGCVAVLKTLAERIGIKL